MSALALVVWSSILIASGAAQSIDAPGEEAMLVGSATVEQQDAPATSGGVPRLVVARASGETLLLDVTHGCERFAAGRSIEFVRRAGDPSLRIIDAVGGAGCVVLATEAIEETTPAPGFAGEADYAGSSQATKRVIRAIQDGLTVLGYDIEATGDAFGPESARALLDYRQRKGHTTRGRSLRFTLWTLGMDVLLESPVAPHSLQIADVLFGASEE